MLRPLPTPGWPPDGWLLVACDVGQGDGLVLHAGGHRAVVVDAGPDPTTMRACLRRLGVDEVPVLVLTHFHADHVGGLPGVFAAAEVDTVVTTALRDPTTTASRVDAEAADEHARVRVAALGEAGQVGDVRWRVLGPPDPPPSPGGEGSAANNASVVVLVEVRGVRVLLPGDVEPEAQALLRRSVPGLTVDVLKVPHHGSRYQDPSWLAGLRPRVALVSVGEGNDYGHPAPETLSVLEATGALVRRTDRDGDVAVVRDGPSLRVVGRSG